MPATLTLLRIKNLALVEDLEWKLSPGFTVITGETGAGKSIIIGALQLLLGERTDKSLLRTGAEICTVEAVFEGSELKKLDALLSDSGVEAGDGELILKRSFSTTGANKQFINGSPTTLNVLKNLGDDLVDLHGPHDHQSLLSPERQLALLDSYAHAGEALAKFEERFHTLQSLRSEHAALSTAESAREQEIDLLRHQVNEITNANLSASEEEEIATHYKLAANRKRLLELAGSITTKLSEADDAILAQLAETQRLLRELEKIDPSKAPLADAHSASVIELTEISRSLGQYVDQLDLDPAQLAALEERVSLFETLKRKYGGSIPEVISFGERAAERMRKIEGRDAELERLNKEIESVRGEVERIGHALHKLRSKAAPKLSESIRANLRDLGFRQSEFEAKLAALDEARSTGFDTVELLFSPNPGEPLKPLRQIASSGEISRLMLAIKSSLAAQDAIPLLVFDEIDANVGGEIANAVGAKMKALAADHQVLCITHLPQVAATATTHFVVTKEVTGGRTHSRLSEVAGKARQEEIARMLGGKTDSALKHAATLLKQS
ncbi:MAG TPA: DNA repair protein RecN [Chthoniobacterales bacterium]|nr:DNA repair protein RecN [Chthoniobacterales bacterium]